MIDRFTAKARESINLAVQAAEELGHSYVGTEHLLIGLLEEGGGVAARVLSENGVKKEKVISLVSQLISPDQTVRMEESGYTPSARRVLENSYKEAVRFKARLIGTEHLLISIIRDNDCVASRLLNTIGISIQKLYIDVLAAMGEDAPANKEELLKGAKTKGSTPTLDSYSRDLTELARAGKLDPVIGRETEIKRLIQILSRRTKNNPCLIGEPGVGKTAVVEGLAQMIIEGNVPETIAEKRVLTLDLSGMVAGSKYRGEFEERIKKVIAEVMEDGEVLLFIDEIHRMNRTVEEILYPAMEDYAIDIIIGKGPSANSIRLDLPRFTLVGATTRAGSLSAPLRDRFGVSLRLELYTPQELAMIVTRSADILDVPIDREGAMEIARRSRGTPRIANRMLRRVRDFAQVRAAGVITQSVADAALTELEGDELGLDSIDRRMLRAIMEFYGGGPVGLDTLAATINEDTVTLEDMYEPYLMQQGFLTRTPRGRCVTQKAYEHLGIPVPHGEDAQQKLY